MTLDQLACLLERSGNPDLSGLSLILRLAPACPVKFFEEKEQSEFNRGFLSKSSRMEKSPSKLNLEHIDRFSELRLNF
jgi:hypothetical protein